LRAAAPRPAWLLLLAVVLAGVAVTAILVRPMVRQPPLGPEQQFEIVTLPVVGIQDLGSFAVSPDGAAVAFVGELQGQPGLWIRTLRSVTPVPLAGTSGASSPFWSPDGRSLAFYADGALKRIEIEGGLVRTVTTAVWGGGGSWNRDGTVLFVRNPAGPIFRVREDGSGGVDALTKVETGEAGHLAPEFLPDGRHFLYFVQGSADRRGVYVSTLDDARYQKKLLTSDSAAVYSRGHLLFLRNRTVLAQSFDADRLTLEGKVFELATDALGTLRETGPQAISAGGNGTLAFRVGSRRPHTQLTWVSRSGDKMGEVGESDSGNSPSASRDLRALALLRVDASGNNDVWLLDTNRGQFTRLTTHPAEDVFPMLSAGGEAVIFASNRDGRWGLYRSDTSGGGARLLWPSVQDVVFPCDQSWDGGTLLYQRQSPSTGWDLWQARLGDPGSATVLVQTAADERGGQISPNGQWLAYESNGSGRYEVFVQPLTNQGRRVQVSAAGGTQVRWRTDGRELFYVRFDGKLMAVPVLTASGKPDMELGAAVPLFAAQVGLVPSPLAGAQYVVAPDGKRFLVNIFRHDQRDTPLRLILNWMPASRQSP
jgi:Tol biopolymer transport system component